MFVCCVTIAAFVDDGVNDNIYAREAAYLYNIYCVFPRPYSSLAITVTKPIVCDSADCRRKIYYYCIIDLYNVPSLSVELLTTSQTAVRPRRIRLFGVLSLLGNYNKHTVYTYIII